MKKTQPPRPIHITRGCQPCNTYHDNTYHDILPSELSKLFSESYDNLLQQSGKLCKPKRQITATGVVNQQWSDESSSGQCTALPICSAALCVLSDADNNSIHRLSAHSKAILRHTRWAVPTAVIACSHTVSFTNQKDMGGVPYVRYITLLCAQLLPSNIVETSHHSDVATAFQTCLHVPARRWRSLPLGQSSWHSQSLHCRFAWTPGS